MTGQPSITAQNRRADPQRVARLGVRFAIIGVVLGLIGPALDTLGAVAGISFLIAIGIFVQAANVAFILGGAIAGIVALARGARPRTLPVLAIAALPISALLIFIEVFVIFLATS